MVLWLGRESRGRTQELPEVAHFPALGPRPTSNDVVPRGLQDVITHVPVLGTGNPAAHQVAASGPRHLHLPAGRAATVGSCRGWPMG